MFGVHAQVTKTLNLAIAGTLSTALTSTELATVTNLILTGTIDARDFKTMRFEMTSLEVLNLNDTKIVAYNGSVGPDFNFRSYSANAIPSFAFVDKKSLKSITLPSTISLIEQNAFNSCVGLSYINFPSSLTTVAEGSFCGCRNLASVFITSNLTTVKLGAFLNCGAFTVDTNNPNYSSNDGVLFNKDQTTLIQCDVNKKGNYTIPFSVKSIGLSAFGDCNALTQINIPSSVNYVGNNAFYGCSGLTSISIPNSVTSILSHTFSYCSGLTAITIPSSVTFIGEWAFSECSSLKSFYTDSKTPIDLSSSPEVFHNVDKATCKLYIPYGSSSLYFGANQWKDFANIVESTDGFHLSATSSTIGEAEGSTATIEINSSTNWTASSNQSWLTVSPLNGTGIGQKLTFTAGVNPLFNKRTAEVTISASGIDSQTITITQDSQSPVKTLESNAGSLSSLGATVLNNITSLTLTGIIDARDFKTIRDQMPLLSILDLSLAKIVEYSGSEGTAYGNIVYQTNTVPESAFQSKQSLVSVALPTTTEVISNSAFWGCTGLTTFNIPSSVRSIGNRFCEGCTKLTSITIPPLLSDIGNNFLAKCSGLTSIVIPSWIKSIGYAALSECKNLSSVTILSPTTTIDEWAFGNCFKLTSLTVAWVIPPRLGNYIFGFVNRNLCTLHVPFGTSSRYATDGQWKEFLHIFEQNSGFVLSAYTAKVASTEGSSASIDLSTNVSWTALSDQNWLNVSPSEGLGNNQKITFTAGENSSHSIRKANIIFSSKGMDSQVITVSQNGSNITLNISPNGLSSALNAEEFASITNMTITGTIDARDFKTISDKMPLLEVLDISEVKIAGYKGPNGTWNVADGYFNDEYPENTIPRNALNNKSLLSITMPKILNSIGDYSLNSSLSSVTVFWPVPLVLSSNSVSLLYVSNCVLHVPYGTASLYRSAERWSHFPQIVETDNGFNASKYTVNLAGEEGSNANIDIKANINWTLSSDQDWLMASPISGNGNQTITFTAKANPLFTSRVAKVAISASGVSSQTITLTQTFQIQPLKSLEITAGALSTTLSADELNTISKLTLTGTIDARDFKTMRDKMPVLAELDISGANIVAYSGSEGTSVWGNKVYQANTIPESAFLIEDPWTGNYSGKISLRSIILPSSLISLGYYAFMYCNGLSDIVIPPLVTSIRDHAFYFCEGLKTISIPLSVKSIENDAFSSCKSIIYMEIPSSVRSIGSNAFFNCTGLTSLTIPSSVTSIGNGAFSSCSGLASITVNWTVPLNLGSSNNVFYNVNKNTCTLKVPYGTTSRYGSAPQWKDFIHVEEKPGFFLPETTAKLDYNDGSSTQISINSNVVWTLNSNQDWISISPSGGLGLTQKITLTANKNSLYTIRAAIITVSADGVESQTISVTQDGSPINLTPGNLGTILSASDLSNITKLIITGNIDARDFKTMRDKMPLLTELDLSGANIVAYKGYEGTSIVGSSEYPMNAIPESAFYNGNVGKSTLTSVVLPLSLTSIGQNAFSYCSGLRGFNVPSLVTSLGNGAFRNCQNLTSVNLPSSLTTIGYGAFLSCKNLLSLNTGCSVPPDLKNSGSVFYEVNKNTCILHVPYGTASRYATAYQWKDFLNIIEASEGFVLSTNTVPLIASEGGAASITVTANVTWSLNSDQTWLNINPKSGTGIKQLITFTVEANQTYVSRTATINISALGCESQTIVVTQDGKLQPPKSVEVIAGGLSTVLNSIDLSTITDLTLTGSIDARDFKTMRDNMPLLSKLNLSATNIVGYQGTGGTSILQNNDYPANTVPEFAFVNNNYIGKTSLTSIVLPLSTISFGQNCFMNCNALKETVIPPAVTSIGIYAFYNCSSLTAINIPATVKIIGNQCFGYIRCPIIVDADNQDFSSISGVLFNKTQSELIQCPVSQVGNFNIPATVLSIRDKSFMGCSGLTSIKIPSTTVSIGTNTFYNCFGLGSIYSYSVSPVNLESSKDVFYYVNKQSCQLYVPNGSKAAYQIANQWKDFDNIIEFNPSISANAGSDQIVFEGSLVTLDGTGSINSGFSILNYKWTAPNGITLSSETSSKPTFTAPEVTQDTQYTFTLFVNDGTSGSTSDQVVITVKQISKVPLANAGPDQTVNEGSLATLDGSGSTSDDNSVLKYKWTAPNGIILSSETVSNPTFTAPEVNQDTQYTFTLFVNDGTSSSNPSQITVTVKNIQPILSMTSKINSLLIPAIDISYHFFKKNGNGFMEENLSPTIVGDAAQFSVDPGEWIVLASCLRTPATFVPTYVGNVLEWDDAEHLIIPEKGNFSKEITCFAPEISNSGLGLISGYVYENAVSQKKGISMTTSNDVFGTPISGALIRLYKKDIKVPIFSVYTDSQGYYKFDGLEFVDYNLVVELPGFVQTDKFDVILSNEMPLFTAYFRVNMASQIITNNCLLSPSVIVLYPNPTKGIINIKGLSMDESNIISVYSIVGKLIKETVANSASEVIDISTQVPGMYLIIVDKQCFKITKE